MREVELNTVTDVDGNIYKTVKIGSQVWMAENLKVIHYRNGDAILNAAEDETWASSARDQSGACCQCGKHKVSNHGLLYNWFAVNDNRIIAPIGISPVLSVPSVLTGVKLSRILISTVFE